MKAINCPICAGPVVVQTAKGRKSNKPFIMLKCTSDGRHFRGFITDQRYVAEIINGNALISGERQGGTLSPPLTQQTYITPKEDKREKRSLMDRLLNRKPEETE